MVEQTSTEKKMTLLEENIRTKGENAYYYAHKRIVDERDGNKEVGQTISGPGIITGGDPTLLHCSDKPVEVIKENKKFIKYVFIDDEGVATVKIELPEEYKEKATADWIKWTITEKSLDLVFTPIDADPYYFTVKKFFKKVIPDDCKYKISKGKIIITLKKKDSDDEWDKLNA